jgi:hypothetical protein
MARDMVELWNRSLSLVLFTLTLLPNTCAILSGHSNGFYSCQVTHPTRQDRGIAPRSSALLHIQHLLHPSLLRPGIRTLHVQVRPHLFNNLLILNVLYLNGLHSFEILDDLTHSFRHFF